MEPISRRSLRKDSLRIEALAVPPLGNNVYIVYEDGEEDAIVIDVAQGSDVILQRLNELDVRARLIVNTHGHTDHTAENELLRRSTGAKLAIHELDAYRLALDDEASTNLGIEKKPIEADLQLTNGEELSFGRDSRVRVIHTPGHTEGSICLFEEKRGQLFSGDTLFKRGYGRVDGMGASAIEMQESLRKLLKLPKNTDVYPGHGEFTTIGDEEAWLKEVTDSAGEDEEKEE